MSNIYIYEKLSRHILWYYGKIVFKRVLEVADQKTRDFLASNLQKAKQLLKICVSSSYLANLLQRKPNLINWLFYQDALAQTKTKDIFLEELRTFIAQPDFPKKLRYFKAKEYLRIWARDINQICSLESSIAELSTLAEACIQACYEHVLTLFNKTTKTPFFVLALGKLGAKELNFYSDVDLVYLYDGSSLQEHEFSVKLAETITKLLQHPSYGEIVFKVDLGLRPGGKESEIVQSIKAAEIYYESFGTALERMSLLRARPIAGDVERGDVFLHELIPFIYRRYLDYTSLEEIRALKKAIDIKSKSQRGLFNIKLGKGGIRELEFFIHTLQLIYGGKFPILQQYNTFQAIHALKKINIIKPEEANRLTRAYRYLRRLEHLCQMATYRQTHTLPSDKNLLLKIVRLMGYVQRDEKLALKTFYSQLEKTRSFVHHLFKELLYTPEEEGDELLSKSLFTGSIFEEEAITYLKKLGFKEPQLSYKILSRLKGVLRSRHASTCARELLISLLPKLLKEIADTQNPDLALVHLEQFIMRIGPRAGFYAMLKENPSLRKLLLNIFGTTKFLSTLLIRHFHLLESLIGALETLPIKTKQELKHNLYTFAKKATDLDEKIVILRRFKNEEILRIGFHDLAGRINHLRVSHQLSLVAELCIEQGLCWSIEEVNKTIPPSELPFIVIALGKLGSQETAYHSDLDLIFIYDYPLQADLTLKQNASIYFVKVAQKLISILTSPHIAGPGYAIDTRLRPSGRFGPLVTSFVSFKDYYLYQAQPWEWQILLKARAIAGDKDLTKKWEDLRLYLLFKKDKNINWRQEIREMRERIYNERARETGKKFNPKLGKGGLIEIEFLVQYLQLQYGKYHTTLHYRHILKALKSIKELNILNQEDVDILIKGYNFLKSLEHRLNLLYDHALDTLITDTDIENIWRYWGLGKPPLEITPEEIPYQAQQLRFQIRKIWEKIIINNSV